MVFKISLDFKFWPYSEDFVLSVIPLQGYKFIFSQSNALIFRIFSPKFQKSFVQLIYLRLFSYEKFRFQQKMTCFQRNFFCYVFKTDLNFGKSLKEIIYHDHRVLEGFTRNSNFWNHNLNTTTLQNEVFRSSWNDYVLV